MSLILAYQNRGLTKNFTIDDAAGNPITLVAADRVRCIIGREGETPVKLSVTSGAPTANGSSVTAGATNVLRLDAGDLAFDPGTYTLFIDFFDSADSNEFKNVDRQTFRLEPT